MNQLKAAIKFKNTMKINLNNFIEDKKCADNFYD